MNELLTRSWWMLALRGIIALVFGVLAAWWPGLTLLWLVALFSAYALLGGAVSIAAAVQNRKSSDDWWLILLLGLIGIGAGMIAVLNPALTALVLVLLMGANALMTGIIDISMGIRLRKVMRGEWLLILTGIASLAFGILVFLFPAAGALAMIWLISTYAIVTGILLLTMAWHARGWSKNTGIPGRLATGGL